MTDRPVEFVSIITCPQCGVAAIEIMPENACRYLYQCESCQVMLKPKDGDCCVFCSYGSVVCPPVQQGTGCCP